MSFSFSNILEVFSEGWHQPVSPSGVPSKARWLPASCIQACRAQPGCSQSDDGTPSWIQTPTRPQSAACRILPPYSFCTARTKCLLKPVHIKYCCKKSDSHTHMILTVAEHARMHAFTPTGTQHWKQTDSAQSGVCNNITRILIFVS